MSVTEAERKEGSAPHNNVVVSLDPTSADWQQASEIEAQVFIDCNYVVSQEELAAEYEKYSPVTEFMVAKKGTVAGGSIRVIHYDPSLGFKTLDDIEKGRLQADEEGHKILETLDLSRTLEIGTLAVDKEFRGTTEDDTRLSVALYGAVYGDALRHGCDNVLASYDLKYFRALKIFFGPAIKALGPAIDYMGSPTIPAIVHIPTLHEHLSRTSQGALAEIITIAEEMQHG